MFCLKLYDIPLLTFDALIFNEDRHFGNFGMMVDNKTDTPYAFAPLFDHGLSLFNYAMPDDPEDLPAYAKTRSSGYGVPFDNIVREFITPRKKEMLRRMIGFTFTRHRNYNRPVRRQKAIEKYLQTRAGERMAIPVRE